jgi:hypothetical protein
LKSTNEENEDKNNIDEKESMDDSAVFYENKKKKALVKIKFEINKKTCRICLEEDEEKTSIINPIVAACLCKGSSGDIHVKCL